MAVEQSPTTTEDERIARSASDDLAEGDRSATVVDKVMRLPGVRWGDGRARPRGDPGAYSCSASIARYRLSLLNSRMRAGGIASGLSSGSFSRAIARSFSARVMPTKSARNLARDRP